MDLIDSHAHIDFPQFNDDRGAMLDRARAAGVNTLLAIGCVGLLWVLLHWHLLNFNLHY